jgi:hypothetical protein
MEKLQINLSNKGLIYPEYLKNSNNSTAKIKTIQLKMSIQPNKHFSKKGKQEANKYIFKKMTITNDYENHNELSYHNS